MASFKRKLPTVRKRIQFLAASLLAFGLLGGIYHLTRTPQFSAHAEFLLPFASEPTAAEADVIRAAQLLASDLVLDRVIETLPKAHHTDWENFAGDPREKLREHLDLVSLPLAQAFRLSYRSRQPETAAAVIEQILKVSQQQWDIAATRNSNGDAERLAKESQIVEQQLQSKQAEWLTLTQGFESRFGTRANPGTDSALANREWQRALDDAHRKHREARADLSAIEQAIHSDVALPSRIWQAPEQGRNGYSASSDAEGGQQPSQSVQARTHLIALEARRENLLRRYGPAHSRVREVEDQIHRAAPGCSKSHQIQDRP